MEQVDDYFGIKIADPYRWLEDDNAAETEEWVKAQNTITQDYLATIPYREKIKERMEKLFGNCDDSKKGSGFRIYSSTN